MQNQSNRNKQPFKFNIVEYTKILADIYLYDLKSNSCLHEKKVKRVIQKFYNQIEKNIKIEGKTETLALYKKLYNVATCIATNQVYDPIKMRKVTKSDKIPLLLIEVKEYLLDNDPKVKSFGLTVASLYKLFYNDPKFDPKSIIDKGPMIEDQDILEWRESCKQFVKRFPIEPISNLSMKTTSSVKAGPNGWPAVLTCFEDMKGIPDPLFDNIVKFMSFYKDSEYFSIYLEKRAEYQYDKRYLSGRIALLAEGGGKTRTVAIADYWTQSAVRPFHDLIMKRLRSIKNDGTYDQQNQFMRMKRLVDNNSQSYDLSSATDRFPARLLEILISEYFGEEFGKLWLQILTERKFSYKHHNLEWGVGQPLGIYSSWPVFSLAHHCFIRHCARLKGLTMGFSSYSVLGDDVVIWKSNKVASHYDWLMRRIGVTINYDKSMTSDRTNLRVEFAKRILYQRKEISPVPHKMILSYYEYPMLIGNLVTDLRRRSLDIGARLIPGEAEVVKASDLTSLLIVRESNLLDALQNEANIWFGRDPKIVLSKISEIRLNLLQQTVTRYNKVLVCKEFSKLAKRLVYRGGGPKRKVRYNGELSSHPVFRSLLRKSEEFHEIMKTLQMISSFGYDTWKEMFGALGGDLPEYVPDPVVHPWFQSRQLTAAKVRLRILTQAHRETLPKDVFHSADMEINPIGDSELVDSLLAFFSVN